MRALHCLVMYLAVVLLAASPLDTAAIIGNSNGRAYEIIVRTDGLATMYSGSTALRTFTLPAGTVQRFFTMLAKARADDWHEVDCSKEPQPHIFHARVAWHGWYSAEVTCQASSSDVDVIYHLGLLRNAVGEIIMWAGYPAVLHCWEAPANGWRPPVCPH